MKTMFAGVAITALLAMPLVAQETDVSAGTVLATVGGEDITVGHVIAMREMLPEQYQQLPDTMLYGEILEQLIQQQVIAQVAAENPSTRMSLGMENERRAFLAAAYLDEVSDFEITEELLQEAYDAQFGSVEPAMEFNASHILVGTEDEALALIEALAAGDDFAELARENSIGPSAPNGGALGWFSAGMMVPEFESAVFELEPTEVSPPVQTQFGWHVVLLNETREAAAPAIEEVQAELIQSLRRARVDARFDELYEAAEIERSDLDIDPSVISNGALLND